MKIAIIFPKDSEALFSRASSRTFGGANVQMYQIAKEMGRHAEHSVYSLIPAYERIDFDDAGDFTLVPTFNESDSIFKKVITYHRTLRRLKPDVILQRGLTLESCLFALYARIFGMRFVFMLAHDIESEGKYQKNHKRCPLFFLLLRFAHLIVAQNELERDNVLRKRPDARVAILKKGIDFSRIRTSRKKDYDAVWIARCEQWKNPEVFIELAGRNPKLKFCMICSPVPGKESYFEEVRMAASAVKNIAFFDFLPQENVYRIISRSRVFCLTSDMEGDWPMTVLEAAAAGVPILSYKLNYGDIFLKYNAGYYCDNDTTRFNEYLNILTRQPMVHREKSSGALAYSRDNHDIHRNIQLLLSLTLKT